MTILLNPEPARAADSDFVIKYYDVPRYDEQGRFQGDISDWPVLLRASGNYRPYGAGIEISVARHPILRYTPSGVWIYTWGGKKFVNLRAGKQWASATEVEAIDQLWHRKRTQVRILESRLTEAKEVHDILVKHFYKKPPAPRSRYYASDYDGY